MLIQGEADHIIICVEVGTTGKIIDFKSAGKEWGFNKMLKNGYFVDELYGVAYPLLLGSNLSN